MPKGLVSRVRKMERKLEQKKKIDARKREIEALRKKAEMLRKKL
jgi:hypothetical protein